MQRLVRAYLAWYLWLRWQRGPLITENNPLPVTVTVTVTVTGYYDLF
jgi:hypothetical protein